MESDKEKREKPPNPRAKANLFTALTFTWLAGTFYKGFQKDFDTEDLYEPLKEHRSDYLGDIFERYWKQELINARKNNRPPKFLNVILRAFWVKNVTYSIIIAFGEIVLRLLQPFLIGLIVRFFSIANNSLKEPSNNDPTYIARITEILGEPKSRITKNEAIFYGVGIVLINFIYIFITHPYLMAMFHQGMKIRVATCSLIYRKALKLSKTSLGETTVGQLVNLLSNDVNRFDSAINLLHYLWIAPVQTAIVTYFMFQVMGWSSFIGVLFLLLLIPLQIYMGKKMSEFRLKTALRTDERVRLMNEIITGIQVIKMYTWETPFSKLVALARRKEINELKGSAIGRAFLSCFLIFSARLSIFVTIITYALLGDIVSADKVFVLTAFFNILRLTMAVCFSRAITQGAEASMSINRLQKFLLYEENPIPIQDNVQESFSNEVDKKSLGIKFGNVSCEWLKDHELTLKNISISVHPGKVLAVIGPVGAGKSSLLNAILRELPVKSGNLSVNGVVSYASQEPWLFSGSIRQNILFGTDFNLHRYQKVVKVCALLRDFDLFPYGDKTIVGERGISLSGGQRARINLARAIYKEADIYLLDDPLSAVDAHVGKHLFDECITKFLNGKTVILVTHQLQYLQSADQIVILHNGSVQSSGSFEELQKSGLDFAKLLHKPVTAQEAETTMKKSSVASVHNKRFSNISASSNISDENKKRPKEVEEQRTKGVLEWKVYVEYFAATQSWFLVFLMIFLFALTEILTIIGDFWTSKWSSDEELNHSNQTNMTDEEREKSTYENIYIYSGVTVSTVLATLIRSFLFFQLCLMISKNLHNNMFFNIACAPMRFFHTNPSGRILNRFSKDMGSVDELLPLAMIDCFQINLQLVGNILLVAVASPILLIPTAVVGIILLFFRVIYVTTSRSIKRLEGVTKSPVFSHLSASLQGLTTIRAFNAQKILEKEFDYHQDLHTTSYYLFIACARAFGFWSDFVCTIFIAVITSSFLFWFARSGADAGLAITQSIAITGMLQWGMRQSAEVENQMTSVERVLEYTKIETEPPFESKPDKKPPASWPSNGAISFQKAVVRYDPAGEPVLHGVTFHITPREKIGIVGRTGAGKTSLIAALFRLAYIEGKITVDSLDTSEIGLHDLRSKISIIPQEPVLFSGTLRKNLDPFDEYPDWLLWQALEEVELKEVVNDNSGGLDTKMAEGGTNFSVGQRQLVCLARAIIRNNKILIMDEATANVDPQTDILIQKTIRRKFNDCTVLTIAHRLNTVMDSDRILVMDAGQVVEFDDPYFLIKDDKSMLSALVNQTGAATSKKLKSIVKKSYKQKLQRAKILQMLQGTTSDYTYPSRSSSLTSSSPTVNRNGLEDFSEESRL